MDAQSRKELAKIGASIPREWLKQGIKTEKPYEFERELVNDAINDPRLSAKKRDWLKKMKDQPDVAALHQRTTTAVDPKIEAKIHDYVDTKVRRAMAQGKIKPGQNDAFMNMVRAKGGKL